ncbi:hypothetical protein [Ralstonia pseudosolanacearum]|uniref:hypothetical protein n=1 Tax=Ralstonia pseudosolanacearum TaxID=1310165 RepID=UPI002234237A|nr:hypothetical protein [Ralstonia sp. RS647]UZF35127.1 hypothetical protein LGV81_00035 [Ralstonia sp. RS647]
MTSKRHIYLTGALAARDFLRRTQSDLHTHQQYQPESCKRPRVDVLAAESAG